MATTQRPIGATVPRPAGPGPGRLAAWCYDHRRRVLASWPLARLRLKQPDLVVSLIATQILGLVMARHVVRTEPLASLPTGPAADAFAPALQLLLSGRYWSE